MALTYLTATQANAAVAAMFTSSGTTYYGSLHTASPSNTGANECTTTSTGYTRQAINFGAPSSGVEVTTNAQNWTNMGAVTITHFGINTTSVVLAATYIGGGALGSSLTVPSGATVAAAIGAISVTVGG